MKKVSTLHSIVGDVERCGNLNVHRLLNYGPAVRSTNRRPPEVLCVVVLPRVEVEVTTLPEQMVRIPPRGSESR